MSKLKELKESRAKVFTQIDDLRKTTDGREMTAEEQTRWNTLLTDYEKADNDVNQEERFAEIERKQVESSIEHGERLKNERNAANQKQDEEYRTAFLDYLVQGQQGIKPENRTLFEQRDGIAGLSGGVIVPKTLSDTIEVALKNYGGMFAAGTILNTSKGGDLTLPTVNDTQAKATIVSEYNQSTKSAPSFGSATLKAYTYRTPIVPVSLELLQDTPFSLESLLGDLLADSFGRGINEDLTIGNGIGKPNGIINSATAVSGVAAANAIKLDDLLDLMKEVDSAYARNGKFMFNRATLYSLIKLKDSQGRYIWQEGTRDGQPSTLFGKQYILNEDIANIGAGNASVLFGDLSKYKIRVVKSFRIIRLNELLAEYLSIGLFGFARADGILLDAGTHPVKKLVHAAE